MVENLLKISPADWIFPNGKPPEAARKGSSSPGQCPYITKNGYFTSPFLLSG
jgi:hypothetical protein